MAKLLRFSCNNNTYLDLADKYVARGELPKAIRALRLSLDGEFSCDTLLSIAENYYNSGMYTMAEAAFLQLYPHPEYRQDALLGLYLVCLQLNDGIKGHFYLNEMVKCGIDLPKEEMDELIRMSEARADEERRAGYKLVYPMPDDDKLMLANEKIVDEDFDGAIRLLYDIKEGSATFAEARCSAAVAFMMQRDSSNAVKECMRALRNDETNLRASAILVSIFAERGQTALMNNLADKMSMAEPKDDEEAINVAITMCQVGRHSDAVRFFRKVREKAYEKNVLEFLAVALFADGRVEEALKVVSDLSSLYGERSNACLYREFIKDGRPIPYFVEAYRPFVDGFVCDQIERFDFIGWDKATQGAEREKLGYIIRHGKADVAIKSLASKKAGREYLKAFIMNSDVSEGDKIRALIALAKKGERPYVMGVAVPARLPRVPSAFADVPGLRSAYLVALSFITVTHPMALNAFNESVQRMVDKVGDFRGFKKADVLAYVMLCGIEGHQHLSEYFSFLFGINSQKAREYSDVIWQVSADKEIL